jgi:cellulose synthase/poly-beta-1,6-N-acetylglucosamine synthase-like glycosyltransferase
MIQTAVVVATALIVAYTLAMYVKGRGKSDADSGAADGSPSPDLSFVFMVPCLNEELVLGRTIDRLLAIESDHRFAVMVIDDGSTDGTAAVTESYDPDRVWLFQRVAPNARQGKGEALNAAYRHLRQHVLTAGQSPDDVVVAVMDADGRLDPRALDLVAPHFADPRRASVQIGVRIHNASDHVVARLQDMEFASYTELFQRGRSALGSAGLGGNGQFARLSALMSLGDAPWSDCLTEDLELGIEFLLGGWTNRFCHETHVSQQGIVEMRPLIKQRTRWFQGHLQCTRFIGRILRSDLRPWPKFDLAFHLVNPLLMLLLQTASLVWLARLGWLVATQPAADTVMMFSGVRPVLLYLLAFGLAPVVTFVYLRAEPKLGIGAGIAFAHLYIFYGYMWYFAGVRATVRHISRRRGWAKTARTTGTGDEARPTGFDVLPYLPASVRWFARIAEPAPTPVARRTDALIELVTLDGDPIGRLDELLAHRPAELPAGLPAERVGALR